MKPLELLPPWRSLSGHGFGLSQPVLLGAVRVDRGAHRHAPALEALLAAEMVSPPEAVPIDDARDLLQRLVFWTGELQRHCRIAVAVGGRVELIPSEGDGEQATRWRVAMPVRNDKVSAALFGELIEWGNTLLTDAPASAEAQAALRARLADILERLRVAAEPGFNQLHLLQAAQRLDIPVWPLQGRKFRLGTGSRMRIVESSINDATSAIGLQLAQSKQLTARILAERGLPTPSHRLVTDADEAEAAALALGFPVVVKPDDQDQGRGVAAHLLSGAEVRSAYEAARALSARVLVERHVAGFGHRLTVADGQLVAALRRRPGGVTGDGVHDVAALLARQLQRPEVRRSLNMGRVALDSEALALLAEQGLEAGSVPAEGRFIRLRRRDNLSAGGTLEHLPLDAVHPDNQRLAVRAAEALFLDVAGIDLLSPDIGRSWRENGAAICEVNGMPQFGPGAGGDNHDRLLTRLFPNGSRIPVKLLLCGRDDAPDLPARLAALGTAHGLGTTACRRAVVQRGELLAEHLPDGSTAARVALFDRHCHGLLLAMTPREVRVRGLPVDRVDAVLIEPQHDWPGPQRSALRAALTLCAAPALAVTTPRIPAAT